MGDLGKRVGAFAAAAALAVAGCSKTESDLSFHPSGVQGVLRIVGVGSIDSLVPELSGNQGSSDIGMFWAAWLYRVDDKGNLFPELATDIPTTANGGISRDGLTIVYHLRRGVRWQDGAPFSARDVIFTWRAIMSPRNNVITRVGYDQIEAMTAPDPYTVNVRLKARYAPAVATYFGPSLVPMCVLPAHILAGLPDINRAPYDSKPIGTGPFVIDRYESGNRVVLKPNAGYWRGAPKLREVDFLVVPDANTRVLMMKAGQADLYYQPADNLVAELRTIPGVRVLDEPFNEFWYIAFNERHPPLDDVRVRRALSMGVDRNYVIRAIANGIGTPANGDQPPFSWAFDPNARAPQYDPARAAALLDEAGWRLGGDGYRYKNGRQLSLVYVTSSGYLEGKRYGPLFQAQMKRIGVDISVKLFPTSVLFAAKEAGGIMNNGKYDIAWTGWIGGVDPDDATLWTCDQQPPSGYNQSFSCDPRIDAQERIALTSYDIGVRRAAYWRIQELIDEDVPGDFLFWTRANDAFRVELKGYRPAPTVTELWNPWQWEI
jgi:peptide/nickel transport system substrate-binding protein